MKLRIHGNSIRLRLLRSEVTQFMQTGRIQQTVCFGPQEEASLTYALEHSPFAADVSVRHAPSSVTVVLSSSRAAAWASSDQVGIYADLAIGANGSLQVAVEKDFACLDLSDAENQDTFPNPQVGVVC